MQFTVGLKLKGKADRIVVDAEDAFIAALKVKTEHPEAVIMTSAHKIGGATHVTHRMRSPIEDQSGKTVRRVAGYYPTSPSERDGGRFARITSLPTAAACIRGNWMALLMCAMPGVASAFRSDTGSAPSRRRL
jgi:hypothetical protein